MLRITALFADVATAAVVALDCAALADSVAAHAAQFMPRKRALPMLPVISLLPLLCLRQRLKMLDEVEREALQTSLP